MSRLLLREHATTPSTPGASTVSLFTDPLSRLGSVDDAGVVSLINTSTIASATASQTSLSGYLSGSSIVVQAGQWKEKTTYRCTFDVSRPSTASNFFLTLVLRLGTLGTISDAAIVTMGFGISTSGAVDQGRVEVVATFRTVGTGTSAVVQGWATCNHARASSGIITTGDAGFGFIKTLSSGFDSTTQTTIGISGTFGATTSNITQVQARLSGI